MQKYNNEILKLQQSKIREFNNLATSLKANLFMTLGEPDFKTPQSIKQATINSINNDNTKYLHTLGNINLRNKIVEFEKNKNNIDYLNTEIIITTGSTEALTASLLTILNADDEVIIPTPCYALYRPIIEFCKAKMITIDTSVNNFQIDKEILKNKITNKTKAILLTSPNNPTGTIYNKETLTSVYELVKNTDIFVICDNCYEQLIYTDQYYNFAKFKDIKKQIIICQSFSKPYAMTGFRIGYLMGDIEFITHATKIHQYMVVTSSSFTNDAAIEALNFDTTEFVNIYKERRDYIYKRIIDMDLEVIKPQGAFYIFPSIKEFNMTSWEFCTKLLEEYSLAIIPGICFEADDFIRLSYCVSKQTIIEACNRLELFITKLRKAS